MKGKVVNITTICEHHGVEVSFIHELKEYDLIEIYSDDADECIIVEQLPKLEKMIRLHKEMHINLQGIHAVQHLLEKVEGLQDEVLSLRRKLKRYEY